MFQGVTNPIYFEFVYTLRVDTTSQQCNHVTVSCQKYLVKLLIVRNGQGMLSPITLLTRLCAREPFFFIPLVIKRILTLHLMLRTTFLIFASQKAPLYLALTSVPTGRKGGSSPCYIKVYYMSISRYNIK